MDLQKGIESGREPFQDHCPCRRIIRSNLTGWIRTLWNGIASSLPGRSNDALGRLEICHSLRCAGWSIQ